MGCDPKLTPKFQALKIVILCFDEVKKQEPHSPCFSSYVSR